VTPRSPHHPRRSSNYTPERGQPTDRALALTNGFSSHPSTTSLSRGAANQAILLQTSGALDRAGVHRPRRQAQAHDHHALDGRGSWLDLDGNHAFDAATEKRDRYPVGAALEGPKRKLPDGTDGDAVARAGVRGQRPVRRPGVPAR
jgi:hypothetical protein